MSLDAWNGVRLEGTVLRSWCGTMVRFWGHGTVQWYGFGVMAPYDDKFCVTSCDMIRLHWGIIWHGDAFLKSLGCKRWCLSRQDLTIVDS